MRSRLRSALAFAALALPLLAQATEIDGSRLAAWWGIPFAGVLLSIAILPLAAPKLWHHHFVIITFIWFR